MMKKSAKRLITAVLLTLVFTAATSVTVWATGYGLGAEPVAPPFVPVILTPAPPPLAALPALPNREPETVQLNATVLALAEAAANIELPEEFVEPAPAVREDVLAAKAEAFAAAEANDDTDEPVIVPLFNVTTIERDILVELFAIAEEMDIEAVVKVSTKVENADGEFVIVGRVSITADCIELLPENVDLSKRLFGPEIEEVYRAVNAQFTNNIAVVEFGHDGEFGLDLKVAVLLDLSSLNTESLRFYAFCAETRTMVHIPTEYEIDEFGFIHFRTPVGGNVVITDRPMNARNQQRQATPRQQNNQA